MNGEVKNNTNSKLNKVENFAKMFFDKTLLKFFLVGIINTIVGNGLEFVLLFMLPIENSALKLFIASATGMVVGSIVSYILNKHFTFRNKEKGWKPVVRFTVNIAVCYAISFVIVAMPVLYVCQSSHLSMFGMSVADFSETMATAARIGAFVCCNYVGQRFFAFKERK